MQNGLTFLGAIDGLYHLPAKIKCARILVCFLLTFFMLTIAGSTAAVEVWVDANNGSDGYAGTQAAPFATIQRACNEPGIGELIIHVLPGEYREEVWIQRDGTRILVDEADRGNVIIYGSENSSGLSWTKQDPAGLPGAASGNVWWADLSSWTDPPQIVYRDTGSTLERLPMAHEPDWTVTTEWKMHENWALADGMVGENAWQLRASLLTTLGDLLGAHVWIKDNKSGHYTYSRTVIAHSGNEVTVSYACRFSGENAIGPRSKFFIEGKATMLDNEGEWFYDSSSQRIYIWPPGGSTPALQNIEISKRLRGIACQHFSDLTVDGVVIRGANHKNDYFESAMGAIAIWSHNTNMSDFTIRNSTIEHCGRGIFVHANSITLSDVLIEDTTIAYIDGEGLDISPANDSHLISDITVQRCILHDLCFRHPEPLNSNPATMFKWVQRVKFLDNELHHFPHNGLMFLGDCRDILVKGNYIHHGGLNAADNGLIKFYNNRWIYDPAWPRSILVTENILTNNMGWTSVSEIDGLWMETGRSGVGIYCDWYKGVTIYRNVAHSFGAAGFWQNVTSDYNWNINNTVLNARYGVLLGDGDNSNAKVINNFSVNLTRWGFPPDTYWNMAASGHHFDKTYQEAHHNAYNDCFYDITYVTGAQGYQCPTVQDIRSMTTWGDGSIDIPNPDSSIVGNASAYNVFPVPGSMLIDAGYDISSDLDPIFQRFGLTHAPPIGSAYDIGAIEGDAGGPWIEVLTPNGSETFDPGEMITVTWQTSVFVGPVRILLATDYDTTPTWYTLKEMTANDGSEAVLLPAAASDSCRIRIEEKWDADPYDLSDADFTITGTPNTITVTSPDGGEGWTAGATETVTWSSSGSVGSVKIELSTDGGSSWTYTLEASTANDGSEDVTVPDVGSATCRIRVSELDGSPSDMSDADFTITVVDTAPPDVSVTDVVINGSATDAEMNPPIVTVAGSNLGQVASFSREVTLTGGTITITAEDTTNTTTVTLDVTVP